MKRIFSPFAYGDAPRDGCWWDSTVEIPGNPVLKGDVTCDVVVIGAGFTGLSAAYHLAQSGASVAVLEAKTVGWGASGRNGGFCCLGGGMASDATLDRRFGKPSRLEWRQAEKAAVELVDELVIGLGLDVDRHSLGETCLAHRPKDARYFERAVASVEENYGVTPTVLSGAQLETEGMSGPFHAGMTVPIGFALNPRKFVAGICAAARDLGVKFFDHSAVAVINTNGVATGQGRVIADRIVLATNGYSSEDIPNWMAGRYMPAQSTVIVTRPLTQNELSAQGWTSAQMAYDSRHLLHYFRLMPDGRFLFGMRGGVFSSSRAEARARARVVQDFRRMFPAWAEVDISNAWSGMVCLARNLVPYVGPIPDAPNVLAGFAYHGNGVAMGTLTGKVLAQLAAGAPLDSYPIVMRGPAKRFPFGSLRRAIMPPLYAAFNLDDAWP